MKDELDQLTKTVIILEYTRKLEAAVREVENNLPRDCDERGFSVYPEHVTSFSIMKPVRDIIEEMRNIVTWIKEGQ